MKGLYLYRGNITNNRYKGVYDGDTIYVDFDLGFDVSLKKQKVRLYGINAPEITGQDKDKGIASRDRLRKYLPVGRPIYIKTYQDKKGSFGRWLGKVYLSENDVELRRSINITMVALGLAKANKYGMKWSIA